MARAEGYNEHMLSGGGDEQYRKLGGFIPRTDNTIRVLDIGCGTGVELDYIWKNAPNAYITCLDLSSDMLALLLKNHPDHHSQIAVVEASYLNWTYPLETFDIVVSSQTMHHFMPEQKIAVYRNLLRTLKPDGVYLENDWYMDAAGAEQYRRRYETIISKIPDHVDAGQYHIDIPFTIDAQRQLFLNAGLHTVEVLESHIRAQWSGGIMKAGKREAV